MGGSATNSGGSLSGGAGATVGGSTQDLRGGAAGSNTGATGFGGTWVEVGRSPSIGGATGGAQTAGGNVTDGSTGGTQTTGGSTIASNGGFGTGPVQGAGGNSPLSTAGTAALGGTSIQSGGSDSKSAGGAVGATGLAGGESSTQVGNATVYNIVDWLLDPNNDPSTSMWRLRSMERVPENRSQKLLELKQLTQLALSSDSNGYKIWGDGPSVVGAHRKSHERHSGVGVRARSDHREFVAGVIMARALQPLDASSAEVCATRTRSRLRIGSDWRPRAE